VSPPAPTPVIDPELFTADAPAFPQKVQDALAVPVDPSVVEVRPYDNLLYVPWIHYQRVLLTAFGRGGYRMVPRGPVRTEGNVVTWLKALFVRVPGETKFQFIKEAKGECRVQGGMTAGNAAEGAHSDALVKCCKELGIFMELFDPSWRRAWEAKYRQTHDKDVKAAQWPKARASAATAAEPVAPASTTPAPTPHAQDAAAPDASPASAPSEPDTGEAATEEQKDALKVEIRKLAWKLGYVRMWFAGLFGPLFSQGDPMEKLTQRQADTAYYLVLAHGKPLYDKLLADEKAKGNVL
jgi:hypothetical protein